MILSAVIRSVSFIKYRMLRSESDICYSNVLTLVPLIVQSIALETFNSNI